MTSTPTTHFTKDDILAQIDRALDVHKATDAEREKVHAAVEREGWLTITGPAVFVHDRMYAIRGWHRGGRSFMVSVEDHPGRAEARRIDEQARAAR